MQKDLIEAETEVQQIRKRHEAELEELQVNLAVTRKELDAVSLQFDAERRGFRHTIDKQSARISELHSTIYRINIELTKQEEIEEKLTTEINRACEQIEELSASKKALSMQY